MILAHLTTLYPGYLADFERRHPGHLNLPYVEHIALLHGDAFAWSNHLTRHLAARGYQTTQFIANYPALQAKWAAVAGLRLHAEHRVDHALITAQLRAARPEVLLVDDCYAFPPDRLQALRSAVPSIRQIVCHQGLDGAARALFPRDALVITPAAHQVEAWRAEGVQAELFRHAFEPAVLDSLPAAPQPATLSFLGSCSPLLHPERHAWLAEIARAFTSLEVWTDSFKPAGWRLLAGSLRRFRLRRLGQHFTSPLRARAHPPLFGRAMFAQLRDSAVTLNCHISLARRSAGNMRLFEATGSGACLVTDARDDLGEIFSPGSEVVTFASTAECLERLHWLSDHPAEAAQIAARGQRRTIGNHTFAHRAAELDDLIARTLRGRQVG